RLSELVGRASNGRSPGEIVAQVRRMASENPGAATAALGALAAAIFGTGAGRNLASSAARMGGLALIGGLAYRAWRNHLQGKPLLDLEAPAPAPRGSGFEAEAATQDHAQLFVRAMIAAATADGMVDEE